MVFLSRSSKYLCDLNYFFTGLDLCFILNATGKRGKEDLSKMIDCIKYIISQIGVSSTNYCVVSLKRGKSFQYIKFDNSESTYINDQEGRGRLVFKNVRGNLIRKLDALNPPLNCCPALHDDFEQAEEAFKSDAVRLTSKKVEYNWIWIQCISII